MSSTEHVSPSSQQQQSEIAGEMLGEPTRGNRRSSQMLATVRRSTVLLYWAGTSRRYLTPGLRRARVRTAIGRLHLCYYYDSPKKKQIPRVRASPNFPCPPNPCLCVCWAPGHTAPAFRPVSQQGALRHRRDASFADGWSSPAFRFAGSAMSQSLSLARSGLGGHRRLFCFFCLSCCLV